MTVCPMIVQSETLFLEKRTKTDKIALEKRTKTVYLPWKNGLNYACEKDRRSN